MNVAVIIWARFVSIRPFVNFRRVADPALTCGTQRYAAVTLSTASRKLNGILRSGPTSFDTVFDIVIQKCIDITTGLKFVTWE